MTMSKVTGFESGPTSSGMMTWYKARLACGHSWSVASDPWGPIVGVNVGDEKPCEVCDDIAADIAWLETLDIKTVHHVRFKERGGGVYLYYRLDHTSPSSFMLIRGTAATPAIDTVLRRIRLSPISPTEQA